MKKRSEATQTLRAGCSTWRLGGPTNKQINKQTHKQTDRQGRLQYTAQLSAQCNKYVSEWMTYIAPKSKRIRVYWDKAR